MACVVCAAKATVYCENDKALLCKECDVRIHTSNAVAARHTRRFPCEGGCSKGASIFCRCDSAYMCESCHNANPLAGSHEVEAVGPLPAIDQVAIGEQLPIAGPAESVAQSAASPAWFIDDEKALASSFDEPAMVSPAGSEAVVPVMSGPIDDFAFAAPATFKEIKDKLEFEALELDNGWLEMGFDFTDILSDGPSDAGLVPNFDVDAAEVVEAMVPTFSGDLPLPEPSVTEAFRKRGADLSDEEPAAKVPAAVVPEVVPPQQLQQLPAAASFAMAQPASAMFFQPALVPQLLAQPPIVAPAPPAPKNTSAYNAALANGANLTREQRVARYREKRKNRKFEKTIRYASRKAYAEIRPRIKGRFAKKEEIEAWKAAHGGDDAVVPEVLDCDF